MKKIMFAAFTASVFFCAMNVQAEESQMRVKLADLNVATDAGARVALARIQFSAANFCEQTSGRDSIERIYVKNRCVAEMTRKSVRQLNAPVVTALAEKPTQVAMAR